MKKNDYILVAVILLLAGLLFGGYKVMHKDDGTIVRISVDGEIKGEYSLDEERRIEINGTNILQIRDGKADMIKADCPDQICVKQKAISKNGETIVCLPHKIVVTIVGNEENNIDAVAD